MKVLMINSVCGVGSTGRICTDIGDILRKNGHDYKVIYGRGPVYLEGDDTYVNLSSFATKINALKARLFDNEGFNAVAQTKKAIQIIRQYEPDIIHLHNLHGYYINVKMLFDYLKNEYKGRVYWSFYDCWSFTGHCAHFDFVKCFEWQHGCENCKHQHRYPKSILLNRSKQNFAKKKQIFSDVDNMSIIVPSMWMYDTVQKSFLSGYDRKIIPNGIKLDRFKPTPSNAKEEWGIDTDRFVVLGVSNYWTETKGVEYFIKLAQDLPKDEYQVVLVGNIHEKILPDNILHIHATDSIEKLCEIYTTADVFVNPTLQETQGLTTIEAFACGTPAVVFNSGGAGECVDDTCGIVVPKGDSLALLDAITAIKEKKVVFSSEDCIEVAKRYDANLLYNEFLKLYEGDV